MGHKYAHKVLRPSGELHGGLAGEDKGVWMVTRTEALAAWSCGVFSLRSDISLQTSLQMGLQWSLQLNPVFYNLIGFLARPLVWRRIWEWSRKAVVHTNTIAKY